MCCDIEFWECLHMVRRRVLTHIVKSLHKFTGTLAFWEYLPRHHAKVTVYYMFNYPPPHHMQHKCTGTLTFWEYLPRHHSKAQKRSQSLCTLDVWKYPPPRTLIFWECLPRHHAKAQKRSLGQGGVCSICMYMYICVHVCTYTCSCIYKYMHMYVYVIHLYMLKIKRRASDKVVYLGCM